jgi:hypothetical protein
VLTAKGKGSGSGKGKGGKLGYEATVGAFISHVDFTHLELHFIDN